MCINTIGLVTHSISIGAVFVVLTSLAWAVDILVRHMKSGGCNRFICTVAEVVANFLYVADGLLVIAAAMAFAWTVVKSC
ncbi:MAG TPA: hypothetical protein VM512_09360 [Burkholderiaceae bacterium]|nr:hypothetical protein [Burkholderiaceae bacterium]